MQRIFRIYDYDDLEYRFHPMFVMKHANENSFKLANTGNDINKCHKYTLKMMFLNYFVPGHVVFTQEKL